MNRRQRFLVLGGGDGWHANQLQRAAQSLACEIDFATYESLVGRIGSSGKADVVCEAGPLSQYDAILPRTMPAGSLEQITFRLATLHSLAQPPIVNSPRGLEIAIDKYATLALVSQLGYAVPKTIVAQTRHEALEAFEALGKDCVVKPIFGGEGRGVMRIADAQLAWYTFSTLETLGAIAYVQEFVAPGGIDTRMLVIGDRIVGVRRCNDDDFRTNLSSGGRSESIELAPQQIAMARRIVAAMGLSFASVDLLETRDGSPRVLEVNAIPGWKGAQQVSNTNIAEALVHLLVKTANSREEAHDG